ncbi:MAG TPA: AAA family ATPase [Limnochordia bacterium]|nr:AAA family ATPase [Limnochordia bacterium]
MQLSQIAYRPGAGRPSTYPFNLPAVRTLDELPFAGPVTCFVGENGSGKSTLLEAIACAAELPTIGAVPLVEDETAAGSRALGARLRLSWARRTRRGFFMRAEDFIGFTRGLRVQKRGLAEDLVQVEAEFAERSDYARGLAMGPLRGSLAALESRYGDLDARSHGESFLDVFRSRFVPDGLYLLDEPETPLSPQSQLALAVMLHDAVARGAQFIIATHSPILMAYPDAAILSFDRDRISRVPYDAVEHVGLYRQVLRDPVQFMRGLLRD